MGVTEQEYAQWELSAEATEAFRATMDHAFQIAHKRDLLDERLEHTLMTAASLARRGVPAALITEAALRLSDEEVRGRRAFSQNVRPNPLVPEGTRVTRLRTTKGPLGADAPAWVYLLIDEMGRVIYVGKTVKGVRRLNGHKSKPWARAEFIACRSERESLALEGDLIFHHKPVFNVADTQMRRRAS